MAKILVVDDNQPLAYVISTRLKVLGQDVTTAYDPEEAVSAIGSQQFDLVVVDKDMKGDPMAWLKVTRAAREQGDMPVVVTAFKVPFYSQHVIRKELHEAGKNIHYLSKDDRHFYSKVLEFAEGRKKGASPAL